VSIKIQIPTPLRRFTAEAGEIDVDGATVGEAMRDLTTKHPALERHIYAGDGTLRSFVNLFLNDEDVRHIGREGAAVKEGDTISIIPSIAGGVR
jgi:molybdopterin converting factor small subunit